MSSSGKAPPAFRRALYAVRGGADVTVIAKDGGALAKAELIQNYYGFENGIPAALLIERGVKQAQNLGVKIVKDEIAGIGFGENGYLVKTVSGEYDAREPSSLPAAYRATCPLSKTSTRSKAKA